MANFMLAEKLPVIRQALRSLVERMGHVVVVEVDSSADALVSLRRHTLDLVILELTIPKQGGLDLVRRIKGHYPDLKLLIYTRQSAEHFAPLCFGAGADGFVSKDEDLGRLETAIKEVLHGRSYFLREHMEHGRGGELDSLTVREMTILQLLAEGQSNKAIAEQLSISFKTVSTHKSNLQEKLKVGSRMELAEVARRNGLGGLPIAESADLLAGQADSGQLELIRALIDASPYPMFIRDIDSSLLFCNQFFLDFYQTSFDQVKGTRLMETPWLLEADRERIQRNFDELVRDCKPFSAKNVVSLRGRKHVLFAWGMPYRGEDGQVIAVLGGLEDLTGHDALLAELRDAKEAAEWENRSRLASLGEVVDELRPMSLALLDATEGLAIESSARQLNDRLSSLETIISAIQGIETNIRPTNLSALVSAWAQLHTARLAYEQGGSEVWGWIAPDVLEAVLQHLSTMLKRPFDMLFHIREGVGAHLLLSFSIKGPLLAAQPSKIELLASRRLADCLDASFDWLLDGDSIIFDLSLECPKATPH
ncbi:putative transcriptional regulator [compost metagenome]